MPFITKPHSEYAPQRTHPTFAAAKRDADRIKMLHGVNVDVVETKTVYTTTTLDEAMGEPLPPADEDEPNVELWSGLWG